MNNQQIQKENLLTNPKFLEIIKKLSQVTNCQKIYLFGSYAYGEPNPDSDIDLYVVFNNEIEDRMDELTKLHIYLFNIEEPWDIDVVGGTINEFNKLKENYSIGKKISQEGILVYDKLQ